MWQGRTFILSREYTERQLCQHVREVKTVRRRSFTAILIFQRQARRGQRAGTALRGLPGSFTTPKLMALSSWFVKRRQRQSHEDVATSEHWTSRLTPRVVMYTCGHALAEYKRYNGAHYALVKRAERTYGGFHGMPCDFLFFFFSLDAFLPNWKVDHFLLCFMTFHLNWHFDFRRTSACRGLNLYPLRQR